MSPFPFFGKKKDSELNQMEDLPTREALSQYLEEKYGVIREQQQMIDELNEKFVREKQKNNTIRQIAHDMATEKELYGLYERIVATTRSEISSQTGFLMLLESGRLSTRYYDGSLTEITMKVIESSPIFYEALHSCRPLRLGSEENELLHSAFAGAHDTIKSFLCVPLKTQHDIRPFGIFGLVNSLAAPDFTWDDEAFLYLIATEAAVAIKNIEYIKEIDLKYDELILGFARAIEAKDGYTYDHIDRVRELSERLAKALGLPDEHVRMIRTAATLHDIGKIGVPDAILNKRGSLDEQEWNEMKKHTTNAMKILGDISSLEREIIKMVLHHHERFDGKGYPDGLRGDEIPIGAQIIAVADVFDGMTSDRPYSKGLHVDEALEKMAGFMGTQFNPHILETFLVMMRKRPIVKRIRQRDSGRELRIFEA